MTIPESAGKDAVEQAASPRESTSTMFGTEREIHESVKPTLGSFPRSVGPAADIREMEYISSLHQNAETFLRLDGTICSKDIAPYLSSRYGMHITKEQAEDIAVNLCGGKLRGELSAERDQQALEETMQDHTDRHAHLLLPVARDDKDDDEEEEEEEDVYYFDLVQVMSLLLIPELVQLRDRHDNTSNGDATFEDNLKSGDAMKLGTEKGGLFDLVIKSITEIFDERLQKDILSGRTTLDADLLATMLNAFGDVDSANDEVLLLRMMKALGGMDAPFTADTLMQAVTGDVLGCSPQNAQIAKDNTPDKGEGPTQTSMFYDIFGRNWEDADRPENPGHMGEAPQPMKTASFIDYAADTYGSVMLNTAVWSLFLLTTLIYLNFFLTLVNTETGGLICPADDSFGCQIGNKVFGWILTAVFCGFYGIFFIVPASIGNVAGKTPMIYVTLFMTALYTYAPFTTLVWYKQGAPHNTVTEHDYRVICPGWMPTENLTALREIQDNLEASELGDKIYLRLDRHCKSATNWCIDHPEVQGKYIDNWPFFLDYDEFEGCYSFFQEFAKDTFFVETGDPCDPFNATCPNSGACALRSLNETVLGESNGNETLPLQDYICCHSQNAVPFLSTRFQDAGYDESYDEIGNSVCSNQPLGALCASTLMCEGGLMCENGVCILPPVENKTGHLGYPCGRDNYECTSGFCWNGTCQEQPQICPLDGLGVFAGFRIDPYCRTLDDWCEYTDLYDLSSTLSQTLEIELPGNYLCLEVLGILQLFGLIHELNETDAEIGYTRIIVNENTVEEVLLQEWAYLVLMSVAVVGSFAILAILRKVIAPKSDDRPRDHKIKCAAANKIGNTIENAIGLHKRGAKGRGRVMRNFFLRGEEKVEVGGLLSTIKKVLSGHLSMKEGIRYPGRIWIGQLAQVVVTLVGTLYGVAAVFVVGGKIDTYREELGRSYTQAEVEDLSNYEWATITADELYVTSEEQFALDTMPERWMWDVAAIPGALAGFLVAIFCILVYVPSTTNTVMKLRSGQLPSLHDPYFKTLRKSPDNVVQNIANMVFGLAGAAVMFAFVIFLIVFAFTYPLTRTYVVNYVAIGIGIGCTMLIKTVGQGLLRSRNFSSFYRKQPRAANAANLFFECWYIGTGALIVVSRLLMFLLSSALWLGRIDVEFLHENIKILGTGLDKIPVSYKRDILVHEAHNHPYIERLGSMYLLRLRDGKDFGSAAGNAWRSLFVCGLMPWIVKHRVNNNEEATILADTSIMPDASGRRGSLIGQSQRRGSVRNSRRSSRKTTVLPSEEALQSSRRESLLASQREEGSCSTRSLVSI